MFGFFDYDKMNTISKTASVYQNAKPFPHIVIDNAADQGKLKDVLSVFPNPGDLTWWSYENQFEKKLAFDKIYLLPMDLKMILSEMNSAPFLDFLEKLTGINGLIADPYYAGGGLHQIPKGGKLDIHADFNWMHKLQLHRRINAIIYLNENWKDEYNGHLELWDREMKIRHQKISPIFNRMVIFNTTDFSYHGHPDPLTCPDDVTRKSLALYYYTVTRPECEISESHSTIYKARPNDENSPELEELRRQRAKGRLENKTT